MHDLGGRRALITGAGGDIGAATARHLAAAGADLVLCDREAASDQLAAVRTSCLETGDVEVATVCFDVTDRRAVVSAVAALPDPPDLLVNNAGHQGTFANVLDVAAVDADAVFGVNIAGALCVLQAFARRAVVDGLSASVVSLASMAGVSGAPNMTPYSMSKAAIVGMTRSAAKDLAPYGIRVNAVSPAFIGPGAMWDNQVARQAAVPSQYYSGDPHEVAAQMVEQVPMRRYGSVDEVASVIGFLLSDDASYLTGVNIEVSGGAA